MIFIVVPAHNEEKTIGRVIRGLFEHGFANVLVVDDASDDATGRLAVEAGAKVLRHEVNRGQGAALQTGDEQAFNSGAEVVIHFDADGQFNPEDISPAVKLLRKNDLDVVLGSRFLDGRSKIPWFKKYIILPISRWVNYFFTGLKLTDAHNGFRIFSRNALEKICITQDGMAHNSEIVYQIKKNDLKWAEHPVEVKYFEYGQGIMGGFKIISDLIIGKFS